MAGRYVLLEFDDRDAANSFVLNRHLPEQLGYEATAMFLKPKSHCQCPAPKKRALSDFVKSPKYGLYLCIRCRKAAPHHMSGIAERLRYVFGFNIIKGVE